MPTARSSTPASAPEPRSAALEVALGERGYPIHIGRDLLGCRELYAPHCSGRQVLIVTNETVAPLYLAPLCTALADARELDSLVLADGEQHKTLETLASIFDTLVERRYGRDCVVVALGGGVVGDLAGFAAACYQRGVALIQVATTLLAQVDSSVGGKTAVNHPLGKNMIGAFHQPVAVIADTATLATLPDRELRAGLAEVIKYGLIRDHAFFEWLERNLDGLLGRAAGPLEHAVRRSCALKAQVVAEDEREHGLRALLNLGHTFGHAIETGLGYGRWLHGEAVAVGLCLAAELSARLGRLDREDVERVRALVARAGLPVRTPAELDAERLLGLMATDKKTRGGRMRLVLLQSIGEALLTADIDRSALLATLDACRDVA